MAFSRSTEPVALASGDDLAKQLVGIGIGLSGRGVRNPNIEDTLLAASIAGMESDDLRVLALLTTWMGTHHPWVNADRLVRVVRTVEHARTRAYWATVGHWLQEDRRFLRLKSLHDGRRVDLLRTGTTLQLLRRGEDDRFADTPLRVPAGVLRDRPGDVATPSALARKHATYRQRVHVGPSYRADMWALLEAEPDLAAAQLARRTYGSYATAWHVKRDFALLST